MGRPQETAIGRHCERKARCHGFEYVRVIEPKTGQFLCEHVRARRGWGHIDDADRPARTPRPTLVLPDRARHAGVHLHAVCTHIHDYEGVVGERRILARWVARP